MNWAIIISAASLALAMLTAAFKISASLATLIQSNRDLKGSLDDFKVTSRAEHAEFHRELDEDRVMLAKQDTVLKQHEKALNNHENRLVLLEGRGCQ